MPVLDNPATVPGSPGVLLHPRQFVRHARLEEVPAPKEWAHLVEKFWSVAWDLPAGAAYVSSLAPLPTTNLTFEHGSLERASTDGSGWYVTGVVSRRRFDTRLTGRGGVVGITFRPGGFAALSGLDASTLRDQVLAARHLLPQVTWPDPLDAADLEPARSARAAAPLLIGLLPALAAGPDPDPDLERLRWAIEAMAERRDADVDALAVAVGTSTRTLQRVFRRLVGVGPKWMLTRARLHDAIARLNDGHAGSTAELAVQLGWFDQAHFIRDFTALVGVPPDAYRRSLEEGAATVPVPGRDEVRP